MRQKRVCALMLAAVVAVSGVMEQEEFLQEMEASFRHKFAKKPEVIEGNMKALKLTFEEIEKSRNSSHETAGQLQKERKAG